MELVEADIEKKEIVKRYRSLLRVWNTKDKANKQMVRRAFDFAMEAHKDIRRKSGEPYIYHPLEVATIIAGEIGLGTTSIVCALLHDVAEDTDYKLPAIRKDFGGKIAWIIDGLTKIDRMIEDPGSSLQAENYKKILRTLSEDVRVIMIKLADRLHNMRTLDVLDKDKQLKISSETFYLFAPLAHRLGLFEIKSELEDLALKFTEPEAYFSIRQKLETTRPDRTRFFNRFIYPVKRDLRHKGMNFEILVREKSIFSIWQKMKNKEIPFEEIFDIFAVRFIIDVPFEKEKEECWKVYSIITDHYRPNPTRLKDWISIPKANGYEALHSTVMSHSGKWVEVQIRTKRMDEIAEKGYAAHWKYKDTLDDETGLKDWLDRIREILTEGDEDAQNFLTDFKLNLFSDEIFVYTPKGDVKTLPAGSTVIDFAYYIHTQVGNTCVGALVNRTLSTLSHVLKNGDQVEVLTSENQLPKEEWLTFAKTAKAKSNIKQSFREARKKLHNLGKAKLEKYFKEAGLTIDKDTLKKFVEFQKVNSLDDLYQMIAEGAIGQPDVKDFSHEGEKRNLFSVLSRPFTKSKPPVYKSLTETIVEKLKEKPESLLLGDDIRDIKYMVSRCCSPIPGDDVAGFITEKGSIDIHRTNCPEAINLMSRYGNRIIKTKWKYKESIGFLTGIKIQGIDKKGLIRKITEVISEKHNINIRSFRLDTSEGMTEGTVMIYVHDTQSLKKLMDNLMKIKEIIKVTRLDRLD